MAIELAEPVPDPGKLALVLSGGGIRAMSQIGVLEALQAYGIDPDVVVGTSGGAIVGALYATGHSPAEMTAAAMAWRDRRRWLIDYNWLGVLQCVLSLSLRPFTGIVRGSRIARALREAIAPFTTFQDLRRSGAKPLFITAVDLNDGQAVVFCEPSWVAGTPDPRTAEFQGYIICGREGIVEAARASYSIPGIFVPARCQAGRCAAACPRSLVKASPERYVDGGVRDFLPLAVAARVAGAGRVIAVNLGYAGMRRDNVANGGLPEILGQVVDITGQDQMEADLNDAAVAKAKVVVINPMIYDVGTFELEYIPHLIDRGRRVAERFFAERGMVKGLSGAENCRRLFAGVTGSLVFPCKGTPAFSDFPAEIKRAYPRPPFTVLGGTRRNKGPAAEV